MIDTIPDRWLPVLSGERSEPLPETRRRKDWEVPIEVYSHASGTLGALTEEDGRLVVRAAADDPYCFATVDLLDIIAWVKKNAPGLLK